MPQMIDIFWSFRSPYSYLVLPQLAALQEEFGVSLNIRPVYPLAVRDVSFFTDSRPQQFPYMVRDMVREAERHGIPFRWPQPDPIIQNMQTKEVAAEQPLIDRLMLLGAAAQQAKGADAFPFFLEISQMLFDGSVDNWHEDDHLATAASRAGVDLSDLEKAVAVDHDKLLILITDNEAEQQKHHWGVPLMVLNGEPFFGQDRIPALKWRLEQTANNS